MAEATVRRVRIPDEDLDFLIRLLKYSDDELGKVLAAIESTSVQGDLDAFPADLARDLRLSPDEGEHLASIILNLYGICEKAGSPDLLLPRLEATLHDQAKLPADLSWSRASVVLRSILAFEDFGLAAKANKLWLEHERTFCRAKIVSDMRPIFDRDVTQSPRAGMIVHELKLSFHKSDRSETEDFYLALTPHHLSVLRTILERAESKENALRQLAEDKHFKLIDV